jgi:asparagine synthase (glutamine-hydrolysing)
MRAKPHITCVNYHSPGSDGDERNFARLSAQRAAEPLIERERNSALSFEPMLHMQRQSAPVTTFLYYLENHRSEAELAADHGATAIFSGNSGDQLFYQANGALGAADYIQTHGLRPRAFGIAFDAARMDRLSIWSVLREGISRGLLGRQWSLRHEAGRYSTLLTPQVIESVRRAERFTHPLLRGAESEPSGKLFHAQSLLFAPALHNPLGRMADPELIAPLYSQPLIELALRIPVYILSAGGWERAIARRAFQHDMPREIVLRRTKGGVEEHSRAILLRNIALLREVLLDGQLVRQGIIDRRKVAEALSGHPTRIASSNVELYECFSAEAWARRWCGAYRQRAAA